MNLNFAEEPLMLERTNQYFMQSNSDTLASSVAAIFADSYEAWKSWKPLFLNISDIIWSSLHNIYLHISRLEYSSPNSEYS